MSDRINVEFQPAKIRVDKIGKNTNLSNEELGEIKIASKLVRHLNMIQEYKDRIDAIDYMIGTAKEKAGNPEFSTENQKVKVAIQNMSGIKDLNVVDFELFEKSIDILLEAYEEQALVSVTGVLNA